MTELSTQPSLEGNPEGQMWVTAQEWLDSPYHKEWNPKGQYRVLFDLGRNYSRNYSSEDFPLYPLGELMIRVKGGWCYQPYRCPGSKTSWVYVSVVDFSGEYRLPSIQEIKEKELTYYRYTIYTWCQSDRQREDFPRTAANPEGAILKSSVTHKELQKILENSRLKAKWEEAQKRAAENLNWYKVEPTKERPVQMYAAGSDDSSYTIMFESIEQAMEYLELLKVEGMPENPEKDGWIFTN